MVNDDLVAIGFMMVRLLKPLEGLFSSLKLKSFGNESENNGETILSVISEKPFSLKSVKIIESKVKSFSKKYGEGLNIESKLENTKLLTFKIKIDERTKKS